MVIGHNKTKALQKLHVDLQTKEVSYGVEGPHEMLMQ
jgi:hypothetical protein